MTRNMLVTGSNRSGTTWVGEMLTLSGELTYLHEPFNPGYWPQMIPGLTTRNLYVCDDNADEWRARLDAVMALRFPLRPQLSGATTPKQAARLLRDAVRVERRRRSGRALLLKDPIAIFSAPWLAETYDLGVVVMIRNPVAYAGSIKRLEWHFDFRNWTDQPLLLRDLLGQYRAELEAACDGGLDLIDQAILQWNVFYATVDRYRDEHPDWAFVDYDDLAADPVTGMASVSAAVGLRYDAEVERGVRAMTGADNPKDAQAGDKGGTHRDSAAARQTWKGRLDDADLDRVRAGTAVVADRFYAADAFWR